MTYIGMIYWPYLMQFYILITWGQFPAPWGGSTGGAGDLFPRVRKSFKDKSSIPRCLRRGFFIDFSHLGRWEDSELKIKKAKNSVSALRKQASGYFQLKEEEERAKQRKESYEKIQKEKEYSRAKLVTIKNNFLSMYTIENPMERGFAFERFLNDFFEYYDLDPRRSFKILGEQIDGAFTFENTDYLVEAKWQKDPVNAGDLYKFAGKISGKLKITMGLFVSINGFSEESLLVDAPGKKSMILMDGADLMAILEERIDLTELLYRKRRYASETGNIYLKICNIL